MIIHVNSLLFQIVISCFIQLPSILINYIFCTEYILCTHWKNMLLSVFPQSQRQAVIDTIPIPCSLTLFAQRLPRSVFGRPYILGASEAHFHLSHLSENFRLHSSQVRILAGITEPSSASVPPPLIMFFIKWDHVGGYELALDWGPQQQSQVYACDLILDTRGPNCGWDNPFLPCLFQLRPEVQTWFGEEAIDPQERKMLVSTS